MKKLFAVVLCCLLTACTVVPIEEIEQIKQSETFDAASYVDTIWQSEIKPAFENNAHDLVTVLAVIQDDLETAGEKYAEISVSGAYNFMVKGSGQVLSVDTSTSNGKAEILLDGYDGAIKVVLQVGPRITGESVRDSVGFIEFGMFKEQTEFGKVSREINNRIANEIVKDLDLQGLVGKKVNFAGAFTIRTTNQTTINTDMITIVPVVFAVEE